MKKSIKKSIKKSLNILLIIMGIVFVIACAGTIYYITCVDPKRGTVKVYLNSEYLTQEFTSTQALEDLEYVYDHICSRHPAWLDGNTELVEATEAQYEQEKQQLSEKKKVTTLEIWQACSRMTSVMRDGHTGVFYNDLMPRYIEDFSQCNQYGMPTKIDGIDFETIEDNFLSTYSYEREEYALSILHGSVVNVEQYLALCGVDTTDGVVFTFDTPEGEQEFTYDFVLWEEVQGVPETQSGDDTETSWVSYSIDSDNQIAIFTLTECNYNEAYRNAVDGFWKEVFDAGIENVIVDLRGNGGGNSTVADYFLGYLNVDSIKGWDYAMRMGPFLYKQDNNVKENPKRDREYNGELYVLTDLHTYSSAMDFAMLVSDNQLGTLIGEASGNMPQGYGDTLGFQTPNAKLGVFISYKRWWRVDKSKGNEPILPDVETESADAMDKAYEIITGTNPNEINELLDQFLNNEIPAMNSESGKTFMVKELLETQPGNEWLEYRIGERLDFDNDGEPEQELKGPYGGMYLDVRDQQIYVFREGEGTAIYSTYTTCEGVFWMVYEDIAHGGRKTYILEKYQGAETVVDKIVLSAEYEGSETGTYDENSNFRYNDEKITMEEYEKFKADYSL